LDHCPPTVSFLAASTWSENAEGARAAGRLAGRHPVAGAAARAGAEPALGSVPGAAHADERLVESRAVIRGLRLWLRARGNAVAWRNGRLAMENRPHCRRREHSGALGRRLEGGDSSRAAQPVRPGVHRFLDTLRAVRMGLDV